jgi:D-xylose transport system substrate-binding protein
MRRAIAVLGKGGFAGVYAETDSVAEGAITAMREAGIDPAARPTTGRFATLAGVRRILAGQQYMTAYAPIGREASAAAEIAIELGGSGEVAEDRVTDEVDKGAGAVPAVLLEPVAVTKANLKRTVIADGSIPTSKLCSGPHRAACRAAGISR